MENGSPRHACHHQPAGTSEENLFDEDQGRDEDGKGVDVMD